jgi:hypothetical protein
MKSYLPLVVSALFGALVATVVCKQALRGAIRSELQNMEQEQRYRCVLSLAALERFETNEPDRAKLLLTREIAMYYKHSLGLPESAERKKTLEHIRVVRGKSPALNEALIKDGQ